MITGPLIAEDIVKYWEPIKYGAVRVNAAKEKNIEKYCTGLLWGLLMGDVQAWFVLSPERRLKATVITRIVKNEGNIPCLTIISGYGYEPTTEEEKVKGMEKLFEFAKNQGCSPTIVALTSNPMAANALNKMGMRKEFEGYSITREA